MAVQACGCSKCLSLLVPEKEGRNASCVRCEQADDVLSVVAALQEEVESLRSIGECEQETGLWCNSLRDRRGGDTHQAEVDPLPCHCQAERGSLRGKEEWKWVPARRRHPEATAVPTNLGSPGASAE